MEEPPRGSFMITLSHGPRPLARYGPDHRGVLSPVPQGRGIAALALGPAPDVSWDHPGAPRGAPRRRAPPVRADPAPHGRVWTSTRPTHGEQPERRRRGYG